MGKRSLLVSASVLCPLCLVAVLTAPACAGDGARLSEATAGFEFISGDAGQTWVRNPFPADPGATLRGAGGRSDDPYEELKSFALDDGAMVASFGDVDGDGLEEMYVEDYAYYSIDCYEFDESLNYAVTRPVEYGLPWVLCDFNHDDAPELVVQRGDPGMSGDGYLDVYTWSGAAFVFIQRLTFPGMKMIYTPTAFDLDGDGLIELIFTTMVTFSSTSYVRVASWSDLHVGFDITYTYYLTNAYGGIAAADFDQDGNGEFAVGASAVGIGPCYAIFEAEGDSIHLSGYLGEEIGSAELALAWDARGNGDVRLVLATCLGFVDDNWRYEVYRAGPDNPDDTFELEAVFERTSIYAGSMHGGTGDTDGDGREEALLTFYPEAILFEWTGTGYAESWVLDQINDTGTIVTIQYPTWDLNGDAYRDWVLIDHLDTCSVYSVVFTGAEGASVAPARLSVCAHPNPTAGATRFDVGPVDSGGRAVVEVYTVDGRLLRRLECAAGRGSTIARGAWDGRDGAGRPVAAGVYYVRAAAGVGSASARVVVLR